MTNAIAVQPIAWESFDAWGCSWAMDMNHAFWLGKAWGEPCMIWLCPAKGEPIRWCQTDANTNAIGDRHPHLNTKDGITTPW